MFQRLTEIVKAIFLIFRGIFRVRPGSDNITIVRGAFDFANAFWNLKWNRVDDRLLHDTDFRTMMQERVGTDSSFAPETLKIYKSQIATLGFILNQVYETHGYDPDFYRNFLSIKVTSDADWMVFRYSQLHDILHIVTGYPPLTDVGEVGIFSFTNGQNSLPTSFLLSVFGMIYQLPKRGPKAFLFAYRVFTSARRNGRQCKNLLGAKFEDLLGENIFTLRERFGIPRYGFAAQDFSEPELQSYSFKEFDPSSSRAES